MMLAPTYVASEMRALDTHTIDTIKFFPSYHVPTIPHAISLLYKGGMWLYVNIWHVAHTVHAYDGSLSSLSESFSKSKILHPVRTASDDLQHLSLNLDQVMVPPIHPSERLSLCMGWHAAQIYK